MTIRYSYRDLVRLGLAVAPWLAGGCSFAVDASLIEKDDAGQVEPQPDAGHVDPRPDAGSDDPDGGVIEPGPDGSVCQSELDCPCEGAGCPDPVVPCDEDDDCAGDEYCAQERGDVCTPKCDATGLCAGPIAHWPGGHLVSDDQRVFWDSLEGLDSHGNLRPDASTGRWMWDGVTAPVELEQTPGRIVAVRSGILYSVGEEGLSRTIIDGVETSTMLDAHAVHAWATDDFVWWSSVDEGVARLMRMPHALLGTPEEMGSAAHGGWTIGNSTYVVRAIDPDPNQPLDVGALLVAPIDDLATETSLLTMQPVSPHLVSVDESAVYICLPDGPASCTRVHRIEFGDTFEDAVAVAGQQNLLDASYVLRPDGWVYWGGSGGGDISYARSHVSLEVDDQPLVSISDSQAPTSFPLGATAHWFFFHFVGEERLFAKPLPPQPCAEHVLCPVNQSCNAGLCE